MTDNEIIKALESEVKSAEYVDSEYCDGVDLTLIKSAVDLINRQHAENINLKGHLEQLKSRYDNAKSEIKRLKGISVSPSKDSMDFCGVLCDYAEELIDKAKSEAYKEFAERLNEKAQMADCFNSYSMVVGTNSINNLLKEMVGDTE